MSVLFVCFDIQCLSTGHVRLFCLGSPLSTCTVPVPLEAPAQCLFPLKHVHSAWAEDVKINLPALEHDKGIVCVLASPRGVCVAFVGAPAHAQKCC